VIPNKIYITITLKNKTINKFYASINEQETKLTTILANLGIDPKNLSLSGASKDITIFRNKDVGVEESKEFTLMVTNATEVNKIFSALNKANIKEAVISSVDHSEIDRLKKEVRIAAIKIAKEKAIYLLAAIDEKPGKPIEITEVNDNNYFYKQNALVSNNRLNYSMPTEEGAVDFEKMKIKFSYFIKYSIQ
jgi:uncharacterized protein